MRRSLQFLQFSLFAIFSLAGSYLFAQTPTVNVFVERFDSPTINMTSSSASGLNNNRWARTSVIAQSAPSSDSAKVALGDILYLTTDTIDVSPYVSVLLSFDHIAKIEGLDKAYVEVSIDKGLTWTHLGPNNSNYQGGANLRGDSTFSEFSDILGWRGNGTPANAAAYPTNAWWRLATFDITDLVGGQSNVLVRFALEDGNNSQGGPANRAGWFIDNVIVAGAACELLPPRVVLSPPSNYPGPYGNGRVYDTGPFEFIASVTDQSGVRAAGTSIFYEVFRPTAPGSGVYTSLGASTAPIVNVSSANFRGVIPQAQIGDSIRYYLQYIDASGCVNTSRIPLVGERYMVIYPDLPQPCEDLPIFDFPYLEDFETFPFDQTGLLYNRWINGQGDFHDWWVGVDSTVTPGTGPSGGKSGQKFLFLEATNHVGQEAHLISPCLDFYETPNPTLEFWYHMNGPHIDTLHIDLFDESIPGWVRDVATPIIGSQGDAWRLKQINFYNYRDRVVQIRLRAKAGKGGTIGDIAIDDFYIFNGPIYNAAVAQVYTTPFTPRTPQNVEFELENFGVIPITTIGATFNVYDRFGNRTATNSQTFTGLNLLPAVKQDLTFSAPYTAPDSTFKIEVIVNLANDTANTNDTNFAFSYGLNKRNVSYFDNYDDPSRADDWVSFPIETSIPSKWRRYQPARAPGSPSTAYSAPFVWGVNGNQKYDIGVDNSLISPFIDFRNTDSTFVQFEMYRDISDSDGVHIEYSLDRGRNWNVIFDDMNPPATLNWYNNLNREYVPCWGDTTSGFERSRIKTTFLDDLDEVMFRFRFLSDSNDFIGFGAVVDNFNIINPEPVDVAVTGVFSPLSYCSIDSARVEYKIENFGRTPVTNIPIEIAIIDSQDNIVDIVNETLNITLNVFDTARVTSSIWSKFTNFDTYTVRVRSLMPNDTEPRNDTAFKIAESYFGCDLTLKFSTTPTVTAGGGLWEVFVNDATPERRLWESTDSLLPSSTYTRTVCIKDSQNVKINLQDAPGNILRFEAQAYGFNYWLTLGSQQNINSSTYKWICPAKLSMGVEEITLIGLEGNLPLAIDYPIEVSLLDDGLDSIDNIKVNLQIDNGPIISEIDTFVPELRYKARRTHLFEDVWTATPGIHRFKSWTSEPNSGTGVDTRASDDTAYYVINILDTVKVNNSSTYCNNFDNGGKAWRAVNAYTYEAAGNGFELGNPTKTFLNGTKSGPNSWVTVLDTTYLNYDSSSIVSDYIELEARKCYEVTFQQRFQTEEDNDGGHFQYSVNDGASWKTLYDNSGVADNWYNSEHIAAILNNSQNAGWTGVTADWVESKNVVGFSQNTRAIFRFRFESDGSVRDEGWQIDDFCLDTISRFDSTKYNNCFPVGLQTFASKNINLSQNVPNPTGGYTKITYGLKTSGMLNFRVTNMLGQEFFTDSQYKTAGDHMIELNVANWANGVYFYSIEFEGERIVKKMVISK